MIDLDSLKYPAGKFKLPEEYTNSAIDTWKNEIRRFPEEFRSVAVQLSSEQLDTPYRKAGWTGRQVIHHVADSHLNALIRVKLALTEDNTTVKPYDEQAWAETAEYKLPIEPSLDQISIIHFKLSTLFDSLTENDFRRLYTHPAENYTRPLAYLLALYSWHGKNHLGHLKILLG